MGALLDLRKAIRRRDPARVAKTLSKANRLVGPHFKFEERHLYPTLIPYVGEAGLMRLLNEHDGVFRGVGRLLELAGKGDWTESDAQAAAATLELIWEHPITCDGLSLYIERLPSIRSSQPARPNGRTASGRDDTAGIPERADLIITARPDRFFGGSNRQVRRRAPSLH